MPASVLEMDKFDLDLWEVVETPQFKGGEDDEDSVSVICSVLCND